MPLDTRLPLLAGQFKPITYQAPSQANMLAEVAQAASAMQGLQRNAMAMREAQQERAAMTGVADMINKAKGQGLTPDMMRQMAGALGGMPRFVNESVKLLQAADVMEREQRDAALIEAIEKGTAAPAGASVPAAPAAGAAPTTTAPAVAQNVPGVVRLQSIFSQQRPSAAPSAVAPPATAASTLAEGPDQSDIMAGGASGTAQVNAMPGAATPLAPIVNQLMTQQAGGKMTPELADAMLAGSRPAAANVMPPADVPGVTRLQRLPPPASARPAPRTTPQVAPTGTATPAATQAALPPEPAPVAAPRAAAPAGVQVAGPMVAGAAPDEDEAALRKQIADLENKRSAYARSNITKEKRASLIKDLDAQIRELRADLRSIDKDQVRSRMRAMGLPETREGFAEYFRMSQPQLGVAEQRLELDRQRMEIDRRRFEVAQAKNEADARVAQRNLSLAERKYELSIRQFELQSDPEYQARIAAARTTANETAKSDVAALREGPSAIEQGKTAMSVLDRMVGNPEGKGAERNPHPGFQGVVGMTWMPGMRLVPGTPEADFDAMLEQVRGGAFLEAYERLRGAAGITEIEGVKGTQAITRMGRSISEAEFIKAADEFRTALKTALDRANKRLTEARSKTQAQAPAGAGTQPPAAPAPGVDRNNPLLK